MNLRIFDSADDLAEAAVEEVVRVAGRAVPAVIALSGGSTPRKVYESLGSTHRSRWASGRVVWVLQDERWVPIDHPESNAGMIRRTLFAEGIPDGQKFIHFDTTLPSATDAAVQMEAELQDAGVSALDLALFGAGEDGHTASLFPGTPVLDVEDRLAASVWVPRLSAWRVTLTAPLLRDARAKFVLAAGESKREVIARIRAGEDLPVARVAGDDRTWWMIDRAASPQELSA